MANHAATRMRNSVTEGRPTDVDGRAILARIMLRPSTTQWVVLGFFKRGSVERTLAFLELLEMEGKKVVDGSSVHVSNLSVRCYCGPTLVSFYERSVTGSVYIMIFVGW